MLKPSAAGIQEQLARILSSPQFCDSPRLQTFLRFVVSLTLEGKAGQIKESTIASEVFGRADTSDDSIVRSAARRLRARLEEYYGQAGVNDPVRIVIPRGGYVPEIQERATGAPPTAEQILDESTDSGESVQAAAFPQLKTDYRRTKLLWVLLAAAVLAICFGAVTLWRSRTRADRRPNIEAQELYLKGRYYWSRRTPDDLNRAVDYFTQAIVKDPGDAQAYAGLADTYNLLSEYTVMPYQEAFRRAIAAAQTAINLDDSLAEAHNSLAFASFYGAWDSGTAEREFRRALQLNANSVVAHHWYATFLMSMGKEQEALFEIDRAQALDPSSRSILADKGLILLYSGKIASARALLEEVAASDPKFLSPHRYLATVYLLEKRYPDYLSQLKIVALLSQDKNRLSVIEAGEKGLAAGRATGMLERMLQAQEVSSASQDTRYYRLAQISALLGNKSKSIEYLQLALNSHDINLVALAIDPCFTETRGDPAFREIVRRVGVIRQPPSASPR